MPNSEPQYDGGNYRVEYMANGIWCKHKTGKYPARKWNHITLGYALYNYGQKTRLGEACRIVYEPTLREVMSNLTLWATPESLAWFEFIRKHIDTIKKNEKERI